MGTRGSYGFRIGNRDKLGYNHYDSYPEGLGVELVKQWKKLISRRKDISKVVTAIAGLRIVGEDENEKPTAEDIAKAKKLDTIDLGVSEGKLEDWYCLTRKAHGDIGLALKLGFMYGGGNGFLKDSLFCEWAYIFNLDTMKLEVYKGFNPAVKKGRKWVPNYDFGRYASLIDGYQKEKLGVKGNTGYFGVFLVAEFPLENLPKPEEFCKAVKAACPPEED